MELDKALLVNLSLLVTFSVSRWFKPPRRYFGETALRNIIGRVCQTTAPAGIPRDLFQTHSKRSQLFTYQSKLRETRVLGRFMGAVSCGGIDAYFLRRRG